MPKARVNGIDLFYDVRGAGAPLLLLAGFSCDHTHWSPVAARLAAEYRVIRLDNRGVGRSSAPDGPYTTRQMADDAAGLLDHLGLAPVHLAGHSMGGQIAQELALARPGLVRSLMLLASYLRPTGRLRLLLESWGDLA